ncbi:GntR family transcriptional regulator [bacterium]|nr:MAG: GntR family transcriptional regulator [bacterium]
MCTKTKVGTLGRRAPRAFLFMAKSFNDVAAEIRARIESGLYASDRPIPSERVLGEEFDVHRATLRRALAKLENEGLLRRSPGERPYPSPMRRPAEGSIGLCATDRDDPFARSLLATGIVQALRESGSNFRLTWADDRAFRPAHPLTPEIQSFVGLVLWPPFLTDVERLREIRKRMPTVLVDAPVGGFESDFVGFQDEKAGYEATQHLIEAGHRRIGFIGMMQVVTTRYRFNGFLRCLNDAGLEQVKGYEPLIYVDRLPATVIDAYFERSLSDRPTAFVCENDEAAARLMPYLSERGLRVPDDVALIGFGGAQPVLLSAMGLTTMEQPYIQAGYEAARLLLRRLEAPGQEPDREVLLPMSLKARSSSGAPKDALV